MNVELNSVTHGVFIISFDDEDIDVWQKFLPWSISKKKSGYARVCKGICIEGKWTTLYLHRAIWEKHFGKLTSEKFIDHKDQNPLNNHKNNFRITDYRGNINNGYTKWFIQANMQSYTVPEFAEILSKQLGYSIPLLEGRLRRQQAINGIVYNLIKVTV